MTAINKVKANWWKVLVVALITSILSAMIHALLPTGSSSLPPSIFVENGLLPIVFIIYGFIYYALLGYIFVIIQNRLIGTKLIKGLKYGIFFCIITFIIYFEPLPTTNTLSLTNMTWMVVDGIPYLILGVLLGRFLSKESKFQKTTKNYPSKKLLIVIPLIFLIGRLISYNIFHIVSRYNNSPLTTLTWVLIVGSVLAILYYYILRPAILNTPKNTAIYFGIIFGIYIFMFNFAYALIVSMSYEGYIDFILRTSMDVIFVTLAIFVFEFLINRNKNFV